MVQILAGTMLAASCSVSSDVPFLMNSVDHVVLYPYDSYNFILLFYFIIIYNLIEACLFSFFVLFYHLKNFLF